MPIGATTLFGTFRSKFEEFLVDHNYMGHVVSEEDIWDSYSQLHWRCYFEGRIEGFTILIASLVVFGKKIWKTYGSSDYGSSDYGSSDGLGHITYSAATALSTMDFSTKAVGDGVVDSPPSKRKCLHPLSSPSPLKNCSNPTSSRDGSPSNAIIQRKFYNDIMGVVPSLQEEERVAKCIVEDYRGVNLKLATGSIIQEPSLKFNALSPLPRLKSPRVATRQCKTHGELKQLYSNCCPWDAWERKSLKRQMREAVCHRSSSSNGYSRGPELLKALETFKSRSAHT